MAEDGVGTQQRPSALNQLTMSGSSPLLASVGVRAPSDPDEGALPLQSVEAPGVGSGG